MRKIPCKVLFASLFISGCDIRPATLEEATKAGDFIKQVITFASLEGIPSNEKITGRWSPQDEAVLIVLSKGFSDDEIEKLKKIIDTQSKLRSIRSTVKVGK